MKKFLENADIYQEATLIVETTNRCDRKCFFCYKKQLGKIKSQDLDQSVYFKSLKGLKKNSLVVLRGGEPTMVINWFDKFVEPALSSGLRIILESDGFFIRRKNYTKMIKKLSYSNLFIRISFDEMHLRGLDKEKIEVGFKKMALFAQDAIQNKINFGFYALGMSSTKILNFTKNTELEPYFKYFHTIIWRNNISRVKLKGKYLRVDGVLSENIR